MDTDAYQVLEQRLIDANRFIGSLSVQGREQLLETLANVTLAASHEISKATELLGKITASAPAIQTALKDAAETIRESGIMAERWAARELDPLLARIHEELENLRNRLNDLERELYPIVNTASEKLSILVDQVTEGQRRLATVAEQFISGLKSANSIIDQTVSENVSQKLANCEKMLNEMTTELDGIVERAKEEVLTEVTEIAEDLCEQAEEQVVGIIEDAVGSAVEPLIIEARELIEETVDDMIGALLGLVGTSEEENSDIRMITQELDPILDPLLSNVEIVSSIG